MDRELERIRTELFPKLRAVHVDDVTSVLKEYEAMEAVIKQYEDENETSSVRNPLCGGTCDAGTCEHCDKSQVAYDYDARDSVSSELSTTYVHGDTRPSAVASDTPTTRESISTCMTINTVNEQEPRSRGYTKTMTAVRRDNFRDMICRQCGWGSESELPTCPRCGRDKRA